jgi:hypothetical protein
MPATEVNQNYFGSFELLHCLGDVRLISRSGRDLNFSYQEISSSSYVQFRSVPNSNHEFRKTQA